MRVDFHSGVADKVGAACRFLHKAQAAGAQVVVCGDRIVLDRLDAALWAFEPLSFVAHARVKDRSPPPAIACTPTWLVDDPNVVAPREVLLNLGPDMVQGWEQFARVVEIVSAEPEDADAGRLRWRQYGASPGVEVIHHPRGAAA